MSHVRAAPGGLVYHVLNRTAGRFKCFRGRGDFEAFERVMLEAHERFPIRICSYCIMPNHWHFVPWPEKDGQLTGFFRWLAHTHAMRWRVAHATVGYGHLYQGRFKSFPIETDPSLLTVCRYVERNALMAGLVKRAEDWQWSSLWTRMHGASKMNALLSDWPVDIPPNWIELVNEPITAKEIERVKISIIRDRPFGNDRWVRQVAHRLHLEQTLQRVGRPTGKKREKN